MMREPLFIDEDEVLLSKKQVARRLGCCPRTVMRKVEARLLPEPIRINCQVIKWPKSVIDKYVQSLIDASEED